MSSKTKLGIEVKTPSGIALYLRVSSEEQTSNTSLSDQERLGRLYAQEQELPVVRVYCDDGFSGTKADRPALQQLRNDILKKPGFDILWCLNIARLSRNLKLLLEVYEQLQAHGLAVVFSQDNVDTSTASGRFHMQIVGSVAELEREAIVERTTRGRIARRAEGGWSGGFCPFGYEYNAESRRPIVVEAEALVVKRIFNLYVERQLGTKAIANILNKEGLRPRTDRARGWHGAAISAIIRDHTYVGLHRVGSVFPAIIPEVVWEMAQKRRDSNRHIRPVAEAPWLLAQRLTCFEHGRVLRAAYSHGKRFYECPCRRPSELVSEAVCTLPRLPAETLEKVVLNQVMEVLGDPDYAKQVADTRIAELESQITTLQASAQPVEDELAKVVAAIDRLSAAWVDGNLRQETYERKLKELKSDQARLAAQREAQGPSDLRELEYLKEKLSVWRDRLQPEYTVDDLSPDDADEYVRQLQAYSDGTSDVEPFDIQSRAVTKGAAGYGPLASLLFAGEMPAVDEAGTGIKWVEVPGPHSMDIAKALIEQVQLKVTAYPDRLQLDGLFPMGDIMFGAVSALDGCRSARCP